MLLVILMDFSATGPERDFFSKFIYFKVMEPTLILPQSPLSKAKLFRIHPMYNLIPLKFTSSKLFLPQISIFFFQHPFKYSKYSSRSFQQDIQL